MNRVEETSIWVVLAMAILCVVHGCKEKIDQDEKEPFAPQVVVGRDVEVCEVPWQVALMIKDSIGVDGLWGAGIIIAEEWILTAAHCFRQYNQDTDLVDVTSIDDLEILAGITDLESDTDRIGISEVIIPSDYQSCGTFNDIALIRLARPLDFNDCSRATIFAPNENEYQSYTAAGVELTIAGWGLDGNFQLQRMLQVADVPIANHKVCQEVNFEERTIVTEDMLCAGHELSGDADACSGDSGGPLYTTDAVGNSILLGIISWGNGCSTSGLYGIYTDFFKYVEWVNRECGDCLRFTADLSS